jgi:2-(1,2-epoxy-1,2-dihydrophenyl)acetyl-CoA isomerase
MAYQNLTLNVSGGIARITLNKPETFNTVSIALCHDLVAVSKEIEADKSVRVMILVGTGAMFSAGGDLNDFIANKHHIHEHVLGMATAFHDAIMRLQLVPAPLIVGVNGTAAGGGFSLVLGGDFIIARKSAKFVSAYTRLGLTPDGGSSWFLPRLVGRQRAFDLMATNRSVGAEEAQQIGIVSRVVEDAEFDSELQKYAEQFAALPNEVVGKLKKLLHREDRESLQAQFDAETQAIAASLAVPGTMERIEGFLTKAKK